MRRRWNGYRRGVRHAQVNKRNIFAALFTWMVLIYLCIFIVVTVNLMKHFHLKKAASRMFFFLPVNCYCCFRSYVMKVARETGPLMSRHVVCTTCATDVHKQTGRSLLWPTLHWPGSANVFCHSSPTWVLWVMSNIIHSPCMGNIHMSGTAECASGIFI